MSVAAADLATAIRPGGRGGRSPNHPRRLCPPRTVHVTQQAGTSAVTGNTAGPVRPPLTDLGPEELGELSALIEKLPVNPAGSA